MLVVISPAKTLDFTTKPVISEFSQPRFLSQSQQLVDKLTTLSVIELASLMKLSDKLAGLNMARFQSWSQPFNLTNAKQALLAFQGDVYTGLAAHSLDKAGFAFAQQHLRILSGLYGLLKPLDLIQAYRLEMGTQFATSQGKDLYQFWDSQLRESLEQELAGEVLINLASNEYFKALQAEKITSRIITPIFKDWKNGQYKIISFYAKKARGLMSRYIIDHKLTIAEQLQQFDGGGYRFNPEMSAGDSWLFTRQIA